MPFDVGGLSFVRVDAPTIPAQLSAAFRHASTRPWQRVDRSRHRRPVRRRRAGRSMLCGLWSARGGRDPVDHAAAPGPRWWQGRIAARARGFLRVERPRRSPATMPLCRRRHIAFSARELPQSASIRVFARRAALADNIRRTLTADRCGGSGRSEALYLVSTGETSTRSAPANGLGSRAHGCGL